MKEHPLFSIITVVKNGDKYLERAINSLLSQTYPNFEYIIIDGASCDSSVSIISKYASYLTYWESESDRGISHALNKGIDHAKGHYVGFLNSDDMYLPQTLEIISMEIRARTQLPVFCGGVRFLEGDRFIVEVPSMPAVIHRESSIHHSSSFIPRHFFTLYGQFSENFKLAMDYELFHRFHYEGVQFCVIPKVLSCRDISGLTSKYAHKALLEVHQVIRTRNSAFKSISILVYSFVKLYLGRIFRAYIPEVYRAYWSRMKSLLTDREQFR